MPEVVLEAMVGKVWWRIGSQGEAEPPGSLTSDGPDGRQVIMFGWYEGTPGVWRSQSGIDEANSAVRVIHSIGFEQQSDLSEPYEFNQHGTRRMRFRLEPT